MSESAKALEINSKQHHSWVLMIPSLLTRQGSIYGKLRLATTFPEWTLMACFLLVVAKLLTLSSPSLLQSQR